MKKTFIYSAIAIVAALASCNKVENPVVAQDECFDVLATVPADVETKTYIDQDGDAYKIYWENGDKLGAGASPVKYSNALEGITPETQSVTFTFTSAVKNNDFVRCPAVSNPAILTIPTEQTSVGGAYDKNANPIWGRVQVSEATTTLPAGKVDFKKSMAMLKFQLKGSATLEKVILETIGGESINGTFNFSGEGVITEKSGNGNSTTITFSPALALSSEVTNLYIPVRPQTYSQGFKLTLHEADGKYMQVKFFTSGQALTSDNLAYFNIAYVASREPVEINALGVLGIVDSKFDDSKPANGIRVGTYNVWSDVDRQEKVGGRTDQYIYRTWSYARDAVAATIASMDCDVLCLNELSGNTYKASGSASLQTAISTYTSAYTYSLDWPNEVNKDHWYSPTSADFTFANGFIYKSSALTLNASGMFWLNSDGKTGWGNEDNDKNAGGKRTCVWAKFTQKSTNKVFYVATAHLSVESQGSSDGDPAGYWNLETAKNLVKNLRARCGASATDPIILCGDMNSSSTTLSQGFNYIVNKCVDTPNATLVFEDVRDYLAANDQLASSEKGLPGTSVSAMNTASYLKSEKHRLDHIMFRGCKVSNFKTYRRTYSVDADATQTFWYPSDHLPLSVDVVLN